MDYFFNFDKMSYLKEQRPTECILCLVNAESSEVVNLSVFRNDLFNVSVNLYPYNPGHLMIFPRRHVEDVRDLTAEEESSLVKVQRAMLEILDRTHAPAGYNIGYNMGLVAGASIRHLHLHVIPRYPRELGIADLVAGRRVLVESPFTTAERIREGLRSYPPSSLNT